MLRWILPLLCRRGHITRNEIGAIRIGPAETHFQVPRAISGKFAAALKRTAGTDDDEEALLIEQSDEAPREAARQNRMGARPGNDAAPRYQPKPHRKGFGKGPGARDGSTPRAKGGKKPGPHRRKDK